VEIHAPHGSIHSWKDLLIQLGIITAGILIALSLERVREWRHERALVREARETTRYGPRRKTSRRSGSTCNRCEPISSLKSS